MLFNITNEAVSYLTRETAKKVIVGAAVELGLENLRYLIATNDAGRFVPIIYNPPSSFLLALAHRKILCIGVAQ